MAVVPFDRLQPRTPKVLITAVSAFGRALEVTPLLRELAGSLLITARRAAGDGGAPGAKPSPGRVRSED